MGDGQKEVEERELDDRNFRLASPFHPSDSKSNITGRTCRNKMPAPQAAPVPRCQGAYDTSDYRRGEVYRKSRCEVEIDHRLEIKLLRV